jgi:hypothetical protein
MSIQTTNNNVVNSHAPIQNNNQDEINAITNNYSFRINVTNYSSNQNSFSDFSKKLFNVMDLDDLVDHNYQGIEEYDALLEDITSFFDEYFIEELEDLNHLDELSSEDKNTIIEFLNVIKNDPNIDEEFIKIQKKFINLCDQGQFILHLYCS